MNEKLKARTLKGWVINFHNPFKYYPLKFNSWKE